MELFFDTSEDKTDVREFTSKVEELMLVNAQEHRPPILRFMWGSLSFDCVMEDLVQRFTLFDNAGIKLIAPLSPKSSNCLCSFAICFMSSFSFSSNFNLESKKF